MAVSSVILASCCMCFCCAVESPLKTKAIETIDLTETDDECLSATSDDDTISCHSFSANGKLASNVIIIVFMHWCIITHSWTFVSLRGGCHCFNLPGLALILHHQSHSLFIA